MFDQVVSLLGRAVELDPDYAEAYAGLAMAHNLDFQNHWTGRARRLRKAGAFRQAGRREGPQRALRPFRRGGDGDLVARPAEGEAGVGGGARDQPELRSTLMGTLGLVEIYRGDP